eukprot:1386196-Rhodomonas_salina.1
MALRWVSLPTATVHVTSLTRQEGNVALVLVQGGKGALRGFLGSAEILCAIACEPGAHSCAREDGDVCRVREVQGRRSVALIHTL